MTALAGTRIGYRDGVPAYVLDRGKVRALDPEEAAPGPEVLRTLTGRRVPATLRGYVGTRV